MKLLKPVMITLFLSLGIHAQGIEVKGIGEVDMKDGNGKDIPQRQAVQAATHMACLKAVEEVISRSSDTLRQQYGERVGDSEDRQKTVAAMVTDKTIQTAPRTTLSTPRMRVYLTGKLDLAALRDQLNLWPKVEKKVNYSEVVAAVFYTVRRTSETRRSSGRESTEETTGVSEEAASEELEENSVRTSEKVREKDTQRKDITNIDRAEKTVNEADAEFKEQWGTGLLGQFTEKGFESMIDGALFEVSDELDADITKRGSPSAKTLNKMIAEVREDDDSTTLVILANLDFSQPLVDPISGMWSVRSTVRGKIYRIPSGGGKARLVSALEPVGHKALGRSQQNAKGKALEEIAPLAADEIISKLVNKGKL